MVFKKQTAVSEAIRMNFIWFLKLSKNKVLYEADDKTVVDQFEFAVRLSLSKPVCFR